MIKVNPEIEDDQAGTLLLVDQLRREELRIRAELDRVTQRLAAAMALLDVSPPSQKVRFGDKPN